VVEHRPYVQLPEQEWSSDGEQAGRPFLFGRRAAFGRIERRQHLTAGRQITLAELGQA
jgi:hypothetical protein